MIIIEHTLHFHTTCPTVVAIGKFDGIHKGHMEILKEMAAYKKQGLATLILTFDNPPKTVIEQTSNILIRKYQVEGGIA